MPRERLPLSFGPGLDRSTGKMEADPRSFAFLANAFTAEGKLIFRPTLATTWYPTLSTETDIVLVYGIRATKDIILVTYDRTSRDVKVWRINPISVPTLQAVGTWANLSASATLKPPRINAAESFGKLYLAHEEPAIAFRLNTQVYTPNANDALVGGLANYTANLDTLGVNPVKFNFVLAYNDSLWGAGYGSNSDADRPEILRVSNPGEPDVMQPQALFYVGARKDPITAALPVGNILAVRKRTEGYRITGNSPSNYGIEPADQGHGCEAFRLACVVGTRAYCWDHSGPRRVLEDGSSVDMGVVLDLPGKDANDVLFLGVGPGTPSGGVISITPTNLRYGFSVFEYNEKILRFVFPNAEAQTENAPEVMCSLRDPDLPRWSHGLFIDGQPLCAANVVTDKALNPPALGGVFDQLALTWTTSEGIISGRLSPTLSFRLTSIAGDELVCIWVRRTGFSSLGEQFSAMVTVPVRRVPGVPQPTMSVVIPGVFRVGDNYDFALTFFRPNAWADTFGGNFSLAAQQAPIVDTANSMQMMTAAWRRISAAQSEVVVSWSIRVSNLASQVLQKATAPGGPWTDVATYLNDERTGVYYPTAAELRTTLYFRVSVRGTGPATYESTYPGGPEGFAAVSCFIGPAGACALRDYGWRNGAPNTLDLFVDSPAGANLLVVEAAVAGAYAEVYRGVPDPSLEKLLTGQAEPDGGAPLETEQVIVPGDRILTEGGSPLTLEGHAIRMTAGFSSYGVQDYGPSVEAALLDPGGSAGPGNPVINSATFPASRTARINAIIQFQSRLVGYYEWLTAEGDSVQRAIATTVVTANVDTDTVLPDSARGQVVTYKYWAIKGPKDILAHDINLGYAPAAAVLGVCP